MIELAPHVYQIPLFPRHAVNAYVIGQTLVDGGIRASRRRILSAVAEQEITTHVLTHAHPDHQGASAAICRTLGVPLWCSEGEKEAAESGFVTGDYDSPSHPIAKFQQRFWAGPGHPVAKVLREGDMVEDFVVLETPGHSAGHVSLWRERDGVLICGDVINSTFALT